ncbi:MAG: hypothetical protein JXN61_06705 [Sedimentisphaerales bacterium]|nr:hypothetical protein [Sedimentisphaerales bacterium]
MAKLIYVSLLISLLGAGLCAGRTITVDANGTGDYPTIRAAIDDANDGDVVEILPGRYTGYWNRNISFRGKAITVRSINPYDPNVVAATIIDCGGTHRGFAFSGGEGIDSVLSGLTITNGRYYYGGAILCTSSSPTISYCRIVHNSASVNYGGGIFCSRSSAVISHCVIAYNSATIGGGGIYYIYGSYPKPIVRHCVIVNNHAEQSGGIGGYVVSVKVSDCIIRDNWAARYSQITVGSGTGSVTYSNVEGGYPGVGNIDLPPEFANPATGDYHLLPSSACIDAGDANSVPPVFLEVDIDGQPRIMGDAPDIGVDEYVSSIPDVIEAAPREIKFDANEGGAHPQAQILCIGSGGSIDWQIMEDCPWLDLQPLSGTCADGDYNEVTLSVDISGLSRGLYDCNLTISDSNAINDPLIVTVDLRIFGPVIEATPPNILFVVDMEDYTAEDKTLLIRNVGWGALNWEITYDCNWLNVNPVTGNSRGEIDEVILSIEANSLASDGAPSVCTLTVSDPNAENTPQTVRVGWSLYDDECFYFSPDHPDYDEWFSVGMPACWCNPRQCHGDTDGLMEGGPKTGYFYVHYDDLNTLIAGWSIAEPPRGPGISTMLGPSGVPAICADFDHDKEGGDKSGYLRVKYNDLNILVGSWNIAEPPKGPGLPADCLSLE